MFRYWYRDNDGVITEFTDRVDRKEHPFEGTTNADEGSVGNATFYIDDPDGDFLIRTHRKIFVTSTVAETSSNRTVWVGYSNLVRTVRKDPWSGRARTLIVEAVDLNTILSRRIMTGKDTARPAETDVARVQWAEATNEGSLIDDDSYIQTDHTVQMDAAPDAYLGQEFINVLSNAANMAVKNYFVFNLDTGDSNTGDYNLYRLWYGLDSSTAFTSSIRFTNVEADVDASTWMVFTDSEIERTGERVHSGAYVPYQGSYVYVQRAQTAADFAQIDRALNGENIKTAAKAKAMATAQLNDHATEEERITVTVRLPEAKVNALHAGQRCQIKLVHSDNQTDYTWCRPLRRTVKERPGTDTVDITYVLAVPRPETAAAATSGVLDEAHGPYQVSEGADLIYFKGSGDSPPAGWPSQPTAGLVSILTDASPPNANWANYGWQMDGTGTVDALFRASAAGVKGNGTYTVTWAIRLNGAVVASEDVVVTGTGLAYWSDQTEVTVAALAVSTGDKLTATVSCNPAMPGAIVVPGGVGWASERFEITGGTLA